MNPSVLHPPSAAHLLRLERARPTPAKADLKNLETQWKALVGRALARAFDLAGLSQKEVAALVDRDPAQVARWTTGAERPPFDALFAVDVLQQPLVIALAALAGQGVEIHTSITLRRIA